jgi:hypothetical protein
MFLSIERYAAIKGLLVPMHSRIILVQAILYRSNAKTRSENVSMDFPMTILSDIKCLLERLQC